jgi:hypothetical protein
MQTVITIAVLSSILAILFFLAMSLLLKRRKICRKQQPVSTQRKDDVYEEIQDTGYRNHDYVSTYVDYDLAFLTRSQRENNDPGTEVYFDVANSRASGGSNVSGYEEPTVKTRNSYIDMLPNETDLENVSKGSHEDSSDLLNYEEPTATTRNSYIDILPNERDLQESHENSSDLVNCMENNCNSMHQHTRVGKHGSEQDAIRILQSDHDYSKDDEESVTYLEPCKVRPNSYVDILPTSDENDFDS